jgi:hypothetical protein
MVDLQGIRDYSLIAPKFLVKQRKTKQRGEQFLEMRTKGRRHDLVIPVVGARC